MALFNDVVQDYISLPKNRLRAETATQFSLQLYDSHQCSGNIKMYEIEAASSKVLSKLKPNTNKWTKQQPPKATKQTRSKLLSKVWKRVRSTVVLPVVRRQYIHLRNGEYEHQVNKWLDALKKMAIKDMHGSEVASIKEMLQVKLVNERARHRAFKATVNEVNVTKDVPRVMQLLMDLRREVYRAVAATYELNNVLFKGAMLDQVQVYNYTPYLANVEARDAVDAWCQRLRKCNGKGLKALPRYPGFPQQLLL